MMEQSNVEQWSWSSYPSIYALGHRYLTDLLKDPVNVEEKVDGSQFSFGVFPVDGKLELKCRSKGAQLNIEAPEQMFKKAVETAHNLAGKLQPGWTYRGEYLAKPKHNTLVYDRVPKDHIIIFDIAKGLESYLLYEEKQNECERLGLEVIPQIYCGYIQSAEEFRQMLDTTSILGGQKIEGVVIKNYYRFGQDKKILLGKFVSEAFKEVHNREWKASNPTQHDIVQRLIESLKTPARWNKAIQHLTEKGELEDSPRDIGKLIKEVPTDIEKEEIEFIKTKLYEWAWPHIRRGVVAGLPEWYKDELLKKQFA